MQPTQAIVDAGSGLRLQVHRYEARAAFVEMSYERAAFLPPSHKTRWIYDPTTALLLFPPAFAALVADAEGRWEQAPLTLQAPGSVGGGKGEGKETAAAASATVQRVVRAVCFICFVWSRKKGGRRLSISLPCLPPPPTHTHTAMAPGAPRPAPPRLPPQL